MLSDLESNSDNKTIKPSAFPPYAARSLYEKTQPETSELLIIILINREQQFSDTDRQQESLHLNYEFDID